MHYFSQQIPLCSCSLGFIPKILFTHPMLGRSICFFQGLVLAATGAHALTSKNSLMRYLCLLKLVSKYFYSWACTKRILKVKEEKTSGSPGNRFLL